MLKKEAAPAGLSLFMSKCHVVVLTIMLVR